MKVHRFIWVHRFIRIWRKSLHKCESGDICCLTAYITSPVAIPSLLRLFDMKHFSAYVILLFFSGLLDTRIIHKVDHVIPSAPSNMKKHSNAEIWLVSPNHKQNYHVLIDTMSPKHNHCPSTKCQLFNVLIHSTELS